MTFGHTYPQSNYIFLHCIYKVITVILSFFYFFLDFYQKIYYIHIILEQQEAAVNLTAVSFFSLNERSYTWKIKFL